MSLGAAAGGADDRVVYDQGSDQLWFDAHGVGAGAAVPCAMFEPQIALGAGRSVIA